MEGLPVVGLKLKSDFSLYSQGCIVNPSDAVALIGEHLYDDAVETAAVICLDAALRPICVNMSSVEQDVGCFFNVPSIARILLLSGAQSYLLMHNHPGGPCKPSPNDAMTTDRFFRLSRTLQIPLYDHIILGVRNGKPEYYSMREHKRIKSMHGASRPIIDQSNENNLYFSDLDTIDASKYDNVLKNIITCRSAKEVDYVRLFHEDPAILRDSHDLLKLEKFHQRMERVAEYGRTTRRFVEPYKEKWVDGKPLTDENRTLPAYDNTDYDNDSR